MKHLKNLSQFALDTLFPIACLSCGKENYYICQDCLSKIPILTSICCPFCGKRLPDGRICGACRRKNNFFLNGLLVASNWHNLLVRQMIYECKYRFIKKLAEPMADIMISFLLRNGLISGLNLNQKNVILIPVPLHKKREIWRGFNQAEIIAFHLCEKLGISPYKGLISRNKYTAPQMGIDEKSEREQNVLNAFSALPDAAIIKNKIVILVDDVCTTGSTLNECAKALAPLKPKQVWGLVLARG